MPFIKVGIAVAIIYLMVDKGLLNLHEMFSVLTARDLALCLFLVFLGLVFSSFRWLVLLSGQGFRAHIAQVFSLQLVGLFFNFVVPGGVGGDLIKGYYLVKSQDNEKFLAATSIFVDRVIGLWTMLIIVVFSGVFIMPVLLVNPKIMYIYKLMMVAGGIFSLILGVAFSKRINSSGIIQKTTSKIIYGEFLYKCYESIHSYCSNKAAIVKAVVLSFSTQVTSILFFYIVGNALGAPLDLKAYLFIVPLGFVCSSLPITPASIGIGQMVFLAIFNLYIGDKTQIGPNSVSLFQIVTFVWGLLGGGIYLFKKKYTLDTKLGL